MTTESEKNAKLRKAASMMFAVLVEKKSFYESLGKRSGLGPIASEVRSLLWRDVDQEALDAMEAYLATINPQPALFEDDAA